jgi:predicted dithiol-disulfide oxidoreductase (DUF899 family)
MVALAKSSVQTLHHLHFPNKSEAYRRARNMLLDEEIKLRRQVERLAAQRRALPAGGELAEDYVFEEADAQRKPVKVKMSELFAPGKDTLAIYSFMFGPERERPCPGCTHFLDCLDGAVRHTREPNVEHVRRHARGPRRFRAEAQLRIDLRASHLLRGVCDSLEGAGGSSSLQTSRGLARID